MKENKEMENAVNYTCGEVAEEKDILSISDLIKSAQILSNKIRQISGELPEGKDPGDVVTDLIKTDVQPFLDLAETVYMLNEEVAKILEKVGISIQKALLDYDKKVSDAHDKIKSFNSK